LSSNSSRTAVEAARKEIHVDAAPVTVLETGDGATGKELKMNADVRTILFNDILNSQANHRIPEVEQIA
jgi:hypothetical protein